MDNGFLWMFLHYINITLACRVLEVSHQMNSCHLKLTEYENIDINENIYFTVVSKLKTSEKA